VRETVWVTGATGYLGTHVVPALTARGHDVVALVRDPERAARLPQLAGCRFHAGDLLDPPSLRGAADGVDTVIHLVGILREHGAATFESVVVEGTSAVLAEARRASARRVLYMSALGADPGGPTAYFRSKGRAEELVRTSGLEWLILRSSVVLGRGGDFLRLLDRLAGTLPVVPVPGHGRFRLQPVHVEDVAEIAGRALERAGVWNRVLGLCGPRPYELRELLRLASRGRPRLFVHVPWPLVVLGTRVMQVLLPSPLATTDELAMLAMDSTCDPVPVEAGFGLALRPVDGLLAGGES
jgi:NADH dehydrogenase